MHHTDSTLCALRGRHAGLTVIVSPDFERFGRHFEITFRHAMEVGSGPVGHVSTIGALRCAVAMLRGGMAGYERERARALGARAS